MHICHCYKRCPLSLGGVQQVILELSKAQVKAGHKVSVLASTMRGRPNREVVNGVNIVRIQPIFNIFKVPIMPTYYHHLSLINPDIIHTHGTIPGVSDVAITYAAVHNKPSVLHYHFDGNADSRIGTFFANVYNRSINVYTAARATKILALSKAYAETSPVLRQHINDIEILPNGVDLTTFNPNINEGNIRDKYKLPASQIAIYAGRFVKYKGLEYLIRAMKFVKDGTLILVGKGQQEAYLRKLIKEENIGNIKFIGSVPHEELPQLFKIGDVYVQPAITRGDTFPLSLMEAMACGLPIISSDVPGTHMMVTQECGIKVKPKDTNGLAQAINELLSNTALKTKMGNASRKAAEKYDWNTISARVLQIYEELLNRSPVVN